jgi:PKD domain
MGPDDSGRRLGDAGAMKTLGTAIAVAVASLVIPAAASATNYCVSVSACVAGEEKPDIASALDAAAQHPGPDQVTIGAGAAPFAEGPLVYDEPDANPVHIRGAGPDATILTGTVTGQPVLSVTGESRVSRLRIRIPAGVPTATGLELRSGADAEDVAVAYDGAISDVVGIATWGGGVVERAVVTMNAGRGVSAEHYDGFTARLTDARVSAPTAVEVVAGAHLVIDHGSIKARDVAVTSGAGSVELFNSLVTTFGPNADGLVAAHGASIAARHVTVARNVDADSDGAAVRVTTGADGAASASLMNTILAGHAVSVACTSSGAAPSELTVRNSNYDAATASFDPAQCATSLHEVTSADPRFVNPRPVGPLVPRNYRLRWDSALVDSGMDMMVSTDLDGLPRFVNDVPDLGAYEYQRRAPVAKLSGPATVGRGARAAFTATGSADPDAGDKLRYAWNFGDGTTAAGTSVTHSWSAAGTFAVTLTVTDPTGLSTSATSQVNVTGAGNSEPEGGDRLPPRVSRLKIRPRRRLATFRLSEDARVNLRLVRGRRASRRLVLHGTRGRNRVALRGPLSHRVGRWRLAVKATDDAGNTARVRSRPFVLVHRPAR